MGINIQHPLVFMQISMNVTAVLTVVSKTVTTTLEATSVPAMLGTDSARTAVGVMVSRST